MIAIITVIACAVALVGVWLIVSKAGQADGICQYGNKDE